nr:F-box only protein 50 isoform X3 [Oryctolagus cuniculus]
MEQERDDDALGGEAEAEGPTRSPELPPPQPSPPPPPSPSPAAPESPRPPQAEPPSEASARQLLLEEWGPLGGGLELPPRLTWKLLLVRRPLYRNLLRSPNPEGINIYQPAPPTGPTQQPLQALGNFRGWHIHTEQLQEGLRYEDSRLDACVYELHVWLLAADRRTVIAQHHVAPRTNGRGPPGRWVQVAHVFRQYGSGVRFVHFLHKTKNRQEPGGVRRTRVTDSSVSVQLRE